jgi:hypothetical protein
MAPSGATPPLKIGYEHNTVNLLLRFARQHADGSWDASGLLSRECFEAWVASKRGEPKKAELNFKEAVLGMLRGKSCSKTTLPVEMQEALLGEVRQKRVWPCFAGRVDEEGNPVTIGATGFRGKAEFQANSEAALARKRLLSPSASFKMPAVKRARGYSGDSGGDGSRLASPSVESSSVTDCASFGDSASLTPAACEASCEAACEAATFAPDVAEARGDYSQLSSRSNNAQRETPSDDLASDSGPSETSSYAASSYAASSCGASSDATSSDATSTCAPVSLFDEERWSDVHAPQQPSYATDQSHVLPRKTSSCNWTITLGRQHTGDEERQSQPGLAGEERQSQPGLAGLDPLLMLDLLL